MAEGFQGFRSFAPTGWEPPAVEQEVELVRSLMAAGDMWCVVAEHGGAMAGHVAFIPAAAGFAPVNDARLAHFRQLFVEPEWWGSGLARRLHAMAIAAAVEQGYSAMRLFTPAGQARARRFYEREGWRQDGESRDAAAGLLTVEYRLRLP